MFKKNIEERLYLCFLLLKLKKTRQKRQHFSRFFRKDLEKVWDVENFCKIDKFRKIRQKNPPKSQHFSILMFLDEQA